MQDYDLDIDDLTKTLTDSFSILANEVQQLSDRKTILEHKLRFAHEQYQQLADKYATNSPDISATLAALQLPPDLHLQTPERATFVPLPSRRPAGSKQQTAEAIRDGRRASQRIASLRGWRKQSTADAYSASETLSSTEATSRRGTSTTTVLEQDFTIPGRMSRLQCPFAQMANGIKPPGHDTLVENDGEPSVVCKDTTPHQSTDPICAAMYEETHNSPPPSVTESAAKCPIRYLDQHSPEDVAKYFETHKHEIPRSHEICVKRYQRNEEDIRKLDAKYGNIVSMIQGLGVKHQPMLPTTAANDEDQEAGRISAERVENWAQTISVNGTEHADILSSPSHVEMSRESRFDRPLKDIRVGESPSRPWGISVPYVEPTVDPIAISPPVSIAAIPQHSTNPVGKCPFGHCGGSAEQMQPDVKEKDLSQPQLEQPTLLQTPDLTKLVSAGGPQVVFTGPVFIGYPIDQAMALLGQWQSGQARHG